MAIEEMKREYFAAVKAMEGARTAICKFYSLYKAEADSLNREQQKAIAAYREDSAAKDQAKELKKQKLDRLVEESESKLHAAKIRLSQALVSDSQEEAVKAKRELYEAQKDFEQAKTAQSVFDEAIGTQYDETLYDGIFELESHNEVIWNECRELKHKLDDVWAEALTNIEKAQKEAQYTSVIGLLSGTREKLIMHFHHDTGKGD